MNWPRHLDYIEAIQHPRLCFRHERLASAETLCDRFGMPLAASGNFACVFRVKGEDGKTKAVRCFTRPVSDHAKRYREIAAFVRRSRNLGLVPLDYHEEGILVKGKWHPIVVMAWVNGITLRAFVESHLDDPPAIRRLRDSWTSLATKLKRRKVAHGDIQHGNVLVTDQQQLVLVDYDAMYLPSFRGEKSPELGHPNWQHPKRNRHDFHQDIDAFASLVLTTSLSALAIDPSLWERFHNGENLLFSRADFESPGDSELFEQLRGIGGEVGTQARKLQRACRSRLSRPRIGLIPALPIPRKRSPQRQSAPLPFSAKASPDETEPLPPPPSLAAIPEPVTAPDLNEPKADLLPAGNDSWWRDQIPPPKVVRQPEPENKFEVASERLPRKPPAIARAPLRPTIGRELVKQFGKQLRGRREYLALLSSGMAAWESWLSSRPRSFFKKAFVAMAIGDVFLFFLVF